MERMLPVSRHRAAQHEALISSQVFVLGVSSHHVAWERKGMPSFTWAKERVQHKIEVYVAPNEQGEDTLKHLLMAVISSPFLYFCPHLLPIRL